MISLKRKIAIVMALSLALSFSACGERKEEKKKTGTIRIGISVYDSYDTFINQLTEKFNTYAASNVSIVSFNANKDQKKQDDQVEDMIYAGCDVICINLVDRTEPGKIIQMAEKNDVPVIFFNRELVEEDLQRWDKLYYIGGDASESGRMQGELFLNDINDGMEKADKNGDGLIQYMVLEGETGHQDAIVRTETSVDTLITGGLKLDDVGSAIANWNREQAQTQISQMINQGVNVELILANNDDMALGAIDAYQKAGTSVEDMPYIYGIDGTKEGLEAIKNGTLKGTVYNDKEGQAKAMYDLATALAKGQSLKKLKFEDDRYIWLPYHKVTRENLNTFL